MSLKRSLFCAAGAALLIMLTSAHAGSAERRPASAASRAVEQYKQLPIPPGFQVMINEQVGPVYADASGNTIYTWPFRAQRAGETGDQIGKSACTFEKRTESSGVFEPYPGGFLLPELDRRRSCAEQWPPVFAAEDAKPVGAWSIIERPEGRKQWAYDGYPLYTYVIDKKPGDVLGGTKGAARDFSESGGGRVAMGPPALVPPTFSVVSTINGRLLLTNKGVSVFVSDADRPGKSSCNEKCLLSWKPIVAPQFAESEGEWSVFERSPGVKQWAFRGRPLYTFAEDGENVRSSMRGGDVPGWHNVYTQQIAPRPSDLTLQDTAAGQVLADSRGHTIYEYNCAEDTIDQFVCDRPDSPQQYKLAICGRGDVDKCLKLFPFVLYSPTAKNESSLWAPLSINQRTWREAGADDKDAVLVWAYKGQPVYTYSGDKKPGDINGDGWGEGGGGRNGFTIFLVRSEFRGAE